MAFSPARHTLRETLEIRNICRLAAHAANFSHLAPPFRNSRALVASGSATSLGMMQRSDTMPAHCSAFIACSGSAPVCSKNIWSTLEPNEAATIAGFKVCPPSQTRFCTVFQVSDFPSRFRFCLTALSTLLTAAPVPAKSIPYVFACFGYSPHIAFAFCGRTFSRSTRFHFIGPFNQGFYLPEESGIGCEFSIAHTRCRIPQCRFHGVPITASE